MKNCSDIDKLVKVEIMATNDKKIRHILKNCLDFQLKYQ